MTTLGELPPADWRRLNTLLEQAMELDPEARDAWLAQLPLQEADLIPTLRRLFDEQRRSDTREPAPVLAALGLFSADGPNSETKPGNRIGPYRLVRELGRGGMAVVWLADRVDGTIERQVAIKIPTIDWTDRGLADRIRRECAVLANLNHPNIAQLYDAGWSDTGLPYLAIEVVDGEPIDRYCAERNLDVRARARLFIDVLRAVSYAHARLVVHRDLKPANVLVGKDGLVKLLDFGIAKILSSDEPTGADSDLTRVSGRPVTLSYAAPEQVLGKPVTTATDIYALGVMLFELLSGKRPFVAAPDTRSAIEEALARGDGPAPSTLSSLPSTARALRGDLDVIVRKALRKEPDGRFETAAAFADDLERYLTGRPIRAQRASAWYVTRRFILRNRLAIGAGAAVVLAVVAGLTIALAQSRRAEMQAQNAAAIGNFVISVIQQADPNQSQETRASDLALLQTLGDHIDLELGKRPELRFALRVAIATAYRNRGEYKTAREILRLAMQDAASPSSIDALDLLRAKILLGGVSENEQERNELLDREIPVLRAMGRVAAPVLVDALITRDSVNNDVRLEDPAASVKTLREALEVATRDIGMADERTLKAANALAYMLGPGVLDKKEEAAAVIEPVYRAVRAAGKLPSSNPTLLATESLYGRILCALGRGDEGIPLLEQVLSEAVAMHHEGKELRGALLYLARGQTEVGRLSDSIATLTSTYALLADREPFGSRLRTAYGGDLAYALLRSRRPLEAEAFVEEQQAYRSSLTESDTSAAASYDFQIGFRRLWIKLQVGEYETARRIGEAMLRRYQEEKSPYYEYVTNIFMPDIYLATGNAAEAEKSAEAELQYAVERGNAAEMEYGTVARAKLALGQAAEALALTENHEGKPDPSDAINVDLANLRLARGRALLALGRVADARKPLSSAYEFWRAFAANDHLAAVAAYWYAQSLLANGETEAAQHLNASPTPLRDYPTADLAALRAERLRSPQQRIEAVLRKYPLRPEVAALISRSASP